MLNLILLATIPPLLIVFFVYRNDLYEKEPQNKLLISTFLLGCVLIIPMIILETLTQMIFTNVLFAFS